MLRIGRVGRLEDPWVCLRLGMAWYTVEVLSFRFQGLRLE